MRSKQLVCWCSAVALFLLSACASTNNGYTGAKYSPVGKVETIFQVSQSPSSCRVFAHLFATMPADMTTRDFSDRITAEAKSKGADLMLIGQSRQSSSESSLNYAYYGPDREYSVREWPGWSFGFEEWAEQGNWATIGYDEWMKSGVHYDYPIVMQVVFLRCQD